MHRFILLVFIVISSLFADTQLKQPTHIQEVEPQDIIEFINDYKEEKPVFIYFSSKGGECEHCTSFNQTIYKKTFNLEKKVDIVSVDFFPWSEIEEFPELMMQYNLLGLPSYMIVYEGKVLVHESGDKNVSTLNNFIDKQIKKLKNRKESSTSTS